MTIKDKIISWYLSNIYIPKFEIIDKPGYICEHVGGQKEIFLREIAFPENIFVELEKIIAKKQKGKNILYSIGKKFGYRYAISSKFTTIDKMSKKVFLQDSYFLVRYIESVSYGKNLNHKVDYNKRIFNLTAKDYIICRKNGLGYILTSGGIAGIWAYMTCNPAVEGIQTKCRGHGDKRCEVICAPTQILKKRKLRFFEETNLKKLDIDQNYKNINEIREPEFAKHSLKDLIDSKFFKYSQGILNYKNERYFLGDASLFYILEKEIKKLKGGEKILFDISFDYGRNLAEKEEKTQDQKIAGKFVTDYMSALGWGDILVLNKPGKYSVISNHFPWTRWVRDTNFMMFRGIVSGLLSGFLNRKITLKKFQTDLSKGCFSVSLDE